MSEDVKRILMVYPSRRFVTPEYILEWHANAIANGRVPAGQHTDDWQRAAADLEDIGVLTLGRQ